MKVALEYVTKQRLFQLCQSHEHQGVVLNVSTYPYVPFESLVEKSKLVLMDNIEDPQNVGAILRCAEVFGWQAVLLSSKGVPGIYPSVVKASAGASEHLLIAQDHAANDYVKALLERNFTLVALDEDGREDLTSLKFEPGKNILLAIGGEHKSIGQYILNLAQHVVRIRQHGKVQSLNAAVAAGIALFVLAEK